MGEWFHLPMVKGALGGLATAMAVDYHAYDRNVGAFNWRVALTRWFLGASIGALAGLGFSA